MPLSLDLETAPELYRILSAEERERAERAVVEDERRRRIAAPGRLRLLLGRYLGWDPAELRFRNGPKGKPYLEGEPPVLQFNLAHSGELALAAVHPELEVGVDVERRRRGIAAGGIAEKFFSPAEAAGLRGLEGAEREEEFYRIWTAKEAFVKAQGAGLEFGLQRFTVAVGERFEVVEIAGDREEAQRWTLWRVEPEPGYTGAVAIRARGLKLRCFEWPQEWESGAAGGGRVA